MSHVRTRLQGDATVNAAINCTLDREGSWTTKQSTTVQCEVTLDIVNNAKSDVPSVSKKCAYLIIVADAADAVSVNFSGRCKFLQI